jgi:hypothetical protein
LSGILGTSGGDVILEGGLDGSSFLNTSSSGSAFTKEGNTTSNTNANGYVIKEADGGWTLSWCKDAYWGQILAVGCGIDGVIKVCLVLVLLTLRKSGPLITDNSFFILGHQSLHARTTKYRLNQPRPILTFDIHFIHHQIIIRTHFPTNPIIAKTFPAA